MFNRESGEFISALANKDGSRFWGSIWRYGYILTAAIPVFSYYYFFVRHHRLTLEKMAD
jgi:putative ATP-binding cassette transporter